MYPLKQRGVRPGGVSLRGCPFIHRGVCVSTASLFPLRNFKFVKICVDSMKSFAREQVRLGGRRGGRGEVHSDKENKLKEGAVVRRLGGSRAQLLADH